ncbi:MAG: hypothetical protein LBC42_03250 [Puniceicoccales bacterium]|jgi:hypothetical protein|nr:hypothetical protein [Puniceicoccales bacterium]
MFGFLAMHPGLELGASGVLGVIAAAAITAVVVLCTTPTATIPFVTLMSINPITAGIIVAAGLTFLCVVLVAHYVFHRNYSTSDLVIIARDPDPVRLVSRLKNSGYYRGGIISVDYDGIDPFTAERLRDLGFLVSIGKTKPCHARGELGQEIIANMVRVMRDAGFPEAAIGTVFKVGHYILPPHRPLTDGQFAALRSMPVAIECEARKYLPRYNIVMVDGDFSQLAQKNPENPPALVILKNDDACFERAQRWQELGWFVLLHTGREFDSANLDLFIEVNKTHFSAIYQDKDNWPEYMFYDHDGLCADSTEILGRARDAGMSVLLRPVATELNYNNFCASYRAFYHSRLPCDPFVPMSSSPRSVDWQWKSLRVDDIDLREEGDVRENVFSKKMIEYAVKLRIRLDWSLSPQEKEAVGLPAGESEVVPRDNVEELLSDFSNPTSRDALKGLLRGKELHVANLRPPFNVENLVWLRENCHVGIRILSSLI